MYISIYNEARIRPASFCLCFCLMLFATFALPSAVSAQTTSQITLTNNVRLSPDSDPSFVPEPFRFSLSTQADILLSNTQTHVYDVSAGSYQLIETTNPDYQFMDCQASFSGGGSGSPIVNGIQLNVAEGESVSVLCRNRQLASITGYIWNDANSSVSYDCDDGCEAKLSGWTVFLDTNNDGNLSAGEQSKVSGADGTYKFTGLAGGYYRVCEITQSGWAHTYPANAGLFYCFSLSVSAYSRYQHVDFGNQQISAPVVIPPATTPVPVTPPTPPIALEVVPVVAPTPATVVPTPTPPTQSQPSVSTPVTTRNVVNPVSITTASDVLKPKIDLVSNTSAGHVLGMQTGPAEDSPVANIVRANPTPTPHILLQLRDWLFSFIQHSDHRVLWLGSYAFVISLLVLVFIKRLRSQNSDSDR